MIHPTARASRLVPEQPSVDFDFAVDLLYKSMKPRRLGLHCKLASTEPSIDALVAAPWRRKAYLRGRHSHCSWHSHRSSSE